MTKSTATPSISPSLQILLWLVWLEVYPHMAPHQIHEVANESLNTAVTLHCYFPRRH